MIFFVSIYSWVFLSAFGKPYTLLNNRHISKILIFLLTILLVCSLPFNVGDSLGDIKNYINVFQSMHSLPLSSTLEATNWEPLFVLIQWVISRFTDDPYAYILCTFVLYIFIFNQSMKKMFVSWQRLFIFFAYINFSFFYAYILNGSRQGFAMMFMLLAIGYWLGDHPSRSYKVFFAGLATALCHYSSIPIVITLLLIKKFNVALRPLLYCWVLLSILYLTGLNSLIGNIPAVNQISFVNGYSDAVSLEYFGGQTNKLSFLLFSAFFLFLSLVFYKKVPMEDQKRTIYLNIIKCYTAFNSYFLLFGFIAFSNRVASYSWFMIPLLMAYPFLNKRNYSPLVMIMLLTFILLIRYLVSGLDVFMGTDIN